MKSPPQTPPVETAMLICLVGLLCWCGGCCSTASGPHGAITANPNPDQYQPVANYVFNDLPKPQQAVARTLQTHGFVGPSFAPGPDAILWAFAGRKDKDNGMTLAVVKLLPSGRAEVRLSPYAYVGSDWALLGRMFAESTQAEAAKMEREINAEGGK